MKICCKQFIGLVLVCFSLHKSLYGYFGNGGFVKDANVSGFSSVAIDPNNNNIVAVGQQVSPNLYAYIEYYINNGASSIVTTFGTIASLPTTSIFKNVIIDGTNGNGALALCTGYTTLSSVNTPLLARYVLNTTESLPTLDDSIFNSVGYYQPALSTNTIASATVTTTLSNQENSIVVGQSQEDAAIIGMVINPGTSSLNTTFNGTGYLEQLGVAGGYDDSFNSTGQTNTNSIMHPLSSGTVYQGVKIDGNGYVVGCGVTNLGSGGNSGLIIRFTPSGALDTSGFDSSGTYGHPGYITDGGSASATNSAVYNAIALDGNSYIIAVGQYYNNGNHYGIISRYTSAGVLDTTFNPNTGYVEDTNVYEYFGVAIDASHRIIAVGTTAASGGHGIIARYIGGTGAQGTPGTRDTTFSTSGSPSAGYITATYSTSFSAVAITGSESSPTIGTEKFVVVGKNSTPAGIVARYNNVVTGQNAGTLDTASFGSGAGYFSSSAGWNVLAYNGVVVDGSSNIVVVGQANPASQNAGILARYSPSGSIDTNFNNNGTHGGQGYVYSTALASADYPNDSTTSFTSLALDGNGNIAVVGDAVNSTGPTNIGVVARFIGGSNQTTAGTLDTTFGNGTYGVGFLYDSTVNAYNAVATDSSNNIIAAGTANSSNYGIITRYLGTGSPLYQNYSDVIYDTGRSSDYIVAVGQNTTTGPIMSSYSIAGVPGTLAGTNPPGNTAGTLLSIYKTTVNSQTLYVVAGNNISGTTSGYIGVLQVSGSTTGAYATFSGAHGGAGYALGNATDGSSLYFDAIVANIGGNPKIIAVGTNSSQTQGIISVFNLTTVGGQMAGSFYTGFNGTGYLLAPTSSSGPNAAVYYSVAVDTNGNIVVAGATSDTTPKGIITRYLPNGQLDLGTYTITELIADFGTALNSMPFWNSTTQKLDLSASTLESQGGTILADVTNFSSLMGPVLTSPGLVKTIDLSGNSISSIPGSETFNGTVFTGLTEIILDNNNTQTSEGTSYPGLATIGAGSFYNLPNITVSLQTLSDLSSIAASTFSGTTTLGALTLGAVSTSGGLTVNGTIPTTSSSTVTITDNTTALNLPAGLFPQAVGTVAITGNTFETTIPAQLFGGAVSSATISNNTNFTALPSIFSAPIDSLTISNNAQLTSIASGVQVENSLVITGNTSLETLPAGLVVGDTLTDLNLSNNGFTGIPADLLDNVTTINGNLDVANNTDLTTVPPVAGITITGSLNASNTGISQLGTNALTGSTIGKLNLDNTPIAPGNVSLFSMDSTSIPDIILTNTPLASTVPALANTSSTAMASVLHAPSSKNIITPIGYGGVATHYQGQGISMGL